MSDISSLVNSRSSRLDDRSCDDHYTLDDFHYELPAELIAQEPLPVRHASRLMCLDRKRKVFSHHQFSEIPDLLQPGDLLVVNNTRVIPARVRATRATGAQVELLLLRPEPDRPGLWHAMATRLRKLRPGELLAVNGKAGASRTIKVKEVTVGGDGQKRLILDFGSQESVYAVLSSNGYAPLPPYIKADDTPSRRAMDLERYQTVFAQAPGAVAAPTAGLHFSAEILERLRNRNIDVAEITLHVGPGTFKPITSSLTEHTIESEPYSISAHTTEAVNSALRERRRVIAVGTTTCRALETAGASGSLQAVREDSTSLYIRPGHCFRIVSGLLTNFHLSRSSLLVLVAAFAGHGLTMSAYRAAVDKRYRFYSYGDAMLIL